MKIRNPDETSIRYKNQPQKARQYTLLIAGRAAIRKERSAEALGPDQLSTEVTAFNYLGLTLSETMNYTSFILAFQLCAILGSSTYYCQAAFFKEIENLKEYFVSMTF